MKIILTDDSKKIISVIQTKTITKKIIPVTIHNFHQNKYEYLLRNW